MVLRATGFHVEFVRDWRQVSARCGDARALTPFQDRRWFDAWYQAFADFHEIEPLIAIVSDAATAELAAIFPLVRRVRRGIRIVEFADHNLTDYNVPLLHAAAPRDAAGMRSLWRDLTAALKRLPGGTDLVRFRKMPFELNGVVNPLTLLDGARLSRLNGNLVTTGDDYDAWRYSLERTVRKELERSWRVFTRHADASFRIVTGQDEALRLLSAMEAQQDARMRNLGLKFMLNDEACAAFYRSLVRENLGNGYAVMSALTVGEEVIAALFGIRRGSAYVMVRISNAGDKWSNCSPGRLIIERTMSALHQDGVRHFDFSIGNYAYKRRFGVAPLPLAEITEALSWRGLPFALRDRAARELHRHPRLSAHVARALGKPSAREDY
ncbi:GNAT family N-acetyltransferase [Bradyrhizobium sp. dw_78]|uniref:GNAT family N-acetyltransferase n=1 Tax=Bradyrhizobium sp. dw_78 TaxID=2719793 RepID=UPI00320A3E55